MSDNASTWTKRTESANIYTSNQLTLAALWKPGPRNPAYKRHEICMILHQLFIPHIIQYKNITDILPFSRHFVYILHHEKTLRRKNGQRVHIRWRSDFPQLLCKNNTILTMSWSFIRFLHWIFNDAEQERIQTSHGAAYGEDHVHAELQP